MKIKFTIAISVFIAMTVIMAFVITPVMALTNSAPTIKGLVGYWAFDEGSGTLVHDSSGNKNSATLVGTPKPSWLAGKNGKAINLSDASQYVDAGTGNTGVYNPGQTFTLSVWVFPTATGKASGADIIQKQTGSAAPYASWSLDFSNNQEFGLGLGGTDNNWYDGKSKTPPVLLNRWYHVVATYDGTTIKTYLNGALSNSEVLPLTIKYTSDKLVFGSWTYGQANNLFFGKIDEARIYNRTLSATEITNLYKAGADIINSQPTLKKTGLDAGLVGYWTMDNNDINWNALTIVDKSGSGINGTLTNMPTSTSQAIGKAGQALKFNGSSGKIIMGNNLNLTNTMTFSAWVKLSTISGAQTIICKAESGAYSVEFNTASAGKFSWNPLINGGYRSVVADSNAVANVWYYVVASYDGSTVKLFINGKQQASTVSISGSVTTTTEPFTIGANPGAGGTSFTNYLNGQIDDVRVYSRALSDAEVKQLYNQGAGTKTASSPTLKPLTLDSGLVGYWTMDGKDINWTTLAMTDKSGNGNTGTLVSLGKTTAPVVGKLGQALKFNGNSGKLVISSNDIFNPKVGNATYSVWVKTPAGSSNYQAIIAKASQYIGFRILTGTSDNSVYLSFESALDTYSNGLVTLNKSFRDNRWHNLSIVLDRTDKIYVYLDGSVAGNLTLGNLANNSITDPGSLNIGYTSANSYFSGSIDDVRIYNRALSASEIKQLYNMGK